MCNEERLEYFERKPLLCTMHVCNQLIYNNLCEKFSKIRVFTIPCLFSKFHMFFNIWIPGCWIGSHIFVLQILLFRYLLLFFQRKITLIYLLFYDFPNLSKELLLPCFWWYYFTKLVVYIKLIGSYSMPNGEIYYTPTNLSFSQLI